jgi:hypothetical protein
MMMYENHSTTMVPRQISVPPTRAPTSLPSTPKFARKFRSNFRPLDLRKITLYGSQNISIEESTSSLGSTPSSSQETSPRGRFVSSSFHSNSHDSFMLKRQSSQTRLRESLLSSLLSPRFVSILYCHLNSPFLLSLEKERTKSGLTGRLLTKPG